VELEIARSRWQQKSEHSKFHSKQNVATKKAKGKKEDSKVGDTAGSRNAADKHTTLRAYRRANNLCFTCGEKWTGRGHKCPTQVPLHVI
jgi:hypothetical protein